jgi:peptide/nickel transport system permease protein
VYWIIVERLPATLLLFGTANLLVFFASVFIALGLSRRYGSALDRTVIALAPSSAAPAWFYGIFLILIFAFLIPVLPAGGMVDVPPPEGTLAYAASLLRHMLLPVAAMFLSSIFISIYSWRTFFLIHSSEDYVEMARAKGLPSRMIERRYVLRPTLSPIITSFALMLIGLWSGAIILEQVFNWPGLGTLLFQAIGHRDTPVIIGTVVIFAYLLAVTVFLLDILYALLDPRVRVGTG